MRLSNIHEVIGSARLYYHGTKGESVPLIMSGGLIYDERKVISGAADNGYVYLTSDINLALEYAGFAGGDEGSGLIVVQIEPRMALADEDIINYYIMDQFPYTDKPLELTDRKVDQVLNGLVEHLRSVGFRDVNIQRAVPALRDAITQQTGGGSREASFRATKLLGTSPPWRNIRVKAPIGFSGANKVIGGIQLNGDESRIYGDIGSAAEQRLKKAVYAARRSMRGDK